MSVDELMPTLFSSNNVNSIKQFLLFLADPAAGSIPVSVIIPTPDY
jgi:hypothetical protein